MIIKCFFGNITFKTWLIILLVLPNQNSFGQKATNVIVNIPTIPVQIDSMIYGQMLENVNDSVIYRGVVSEDGKVRTHLIPLLKELKIPIMRWPGGTVVHEYHWRNGVGPKELRPKVFTHAWKGKETYQFGTDEFLQWCNEIGTTPYLNFNMGNDAEYGGTLGEAMEWIEYVNGNPDSSNFGKMRAHFGHKSPYNVLYWCLGNENYGPWGKHVAENAEQYGTLLSLWAETINKKFEHLKLIGVGHTSEWNKTVLEKAGKEIDFLTQHYYITSKFKNDTIENPHNSLFAPVLMEEHLKLLGKHLNLYNSLNRKNTIPIRLSIDEYNNRHFVSNGKEYKFNRQDPRRLADVAIIAGMLNVFIRNSDIVGMANYIFPVNGHGLIRTNGDDDAFKTPLFFLFKKYRELMNGNRMNVKVDGNSILSSQIIPSIEGDCKEIKLTDQQISYIDAAATLTVHGSLNVALINRSANHTQKVSVNVPAGFILKEKWEMSAKDINEYNSLAERDNIIPKVTTLKKYLHKKVKVEMTPCSVAILSFSSELENDK